MTYSVIAGEGHRVPIKNWSGNLDEKTLQQATNLSNLPFIHKWLSLMPDAHAGYGMPIGGVMAAKAAVVPYAIGVDIGCGVMLVDLNLKKEQLMSKDGGTFGGVLALTAKSVPTGFSAHKNAFTQDVAVGFIEKDPPSSLPDGAWGKSLFQLGTLGGGNHFLEFQVDEEDNVFIMLHSGSRGLGKAICDFYHKAALSMNRKYYSDLPDKELAYIPQGEPLFGRYWSAMSFAMAWAEANRALMMEAAIKAVSMLVDDFDHADLVAECHHNYANIENHYGLNVIVHRKGAVSASVDDKVLIPGSMGTASYLAEGLGNEESFRSCQHGAGRLHARGAMHRSTTADSVYNDMAERGIVLVSSSPADVMEEAPSAYKDIEDVMARSTDLVKPLKRLTPIGVVKG